MSERLLNMLGLMRKANCIDIGETNTGIVARAGKAKLMVIAADASENARSRARGFAAVRDTLSVTLPFTKEDISSHVGLRGCSMAAITDIGFARAFIRGLSQEYPDGGYGEAAALIEEKFIRAEKRRKEAAAHERNKRNGKRRTNV